MSGEEKPPVLRELAKGAHHQVDRISPILDRRLKVASYVFAGLAGLGTFISMGDLDTQGRTHCFTNFWYYMRSKRDEFFLAALPGSAAAMPEATTSQPTEQAQDPPTAQKPN
jgi:hypothetical protein